MAKGTPKRCSRAGWKSKKQRAAAAIPLNKERRRQREIKRVERKIAKFERKGRDTSGLERELGYLKKPDTRPKFSSGREADERLKKRAA